MSTLPAAFPLEPSKFPYTKSTVAEKRNARATLQNQLFFDLVLTEVARIPNPAKLYPPRNSAELRTLHEAIAACPVDLLKKQCCLYYVLRDWDTHEQYARDQLIPHNYCALMDSYWYLDQARYEQALRALTTPGLTPNFATKIMATFSMAGQGPMLVQYVQTLQNPLDTMDKMTLYLDALVRMDVRAAIRYTRTLGELRESLFERVLEHAKTTKEGGRVLADYPFDEQEERWAFEVLSRQPGNGLEALILRLTMLGDAPTVLKLRSQHGGGPAELNTAMRRALHPVEQKLLEATQ